MADTLGDCSAAGGAGDSLSPRSSVDDDEDNWRFAVGAAVSRTTSTVAIAGAADGTATPLSESDSSGDISDGIRMHWSSKAASTNAGDMVPDITSANVRPPVGRSLRSIRDDVVH